MNKGHLNRVIFPILHLLLIVCCGCTDNTLKENEELLVFKDAFVIGFDQCAAFRGRVLAIVEPADTILTYNFPDSIYSFPDSLFSNFRFDCLFPNHALSAYPVRVQYRPSTQWEFTGYLCYDDMYTVRLVELLENKQVVIVSIAK